VGLPAVAGTRTTGLAARAGTALEHVGQPGAPRQLLVGVGGLLPVCESGGVSNGGVETPSAVAVRVHRGARTPRGCRSGWTAP